jgi:hypothetical protein
VAEVIPIALVSLSIFTESKVNRFHPLRYLAHHSYPTSTSTIITSIIITSPTTTLPQHHHQSISPKLNLHHLFDEVSCTHAQAQIKFAAKAQ